MLDCDTLFDPAPPPTHHPIIKSIGGKWYWRSKLIPLLPPIASHLGIRQIVSPFLGGGSLELTLAYFGVRVFGGDLFRPLVCAWNLLLTNPASAAQALADYGLNASPPVDRLRAAKRDLTDALEAGLPDEEIGRRFLCVNLSTYNGILTGGPRPSGGDYFFEPTFLRRVEEFSAPNFAPVRECDYAALLDEHGDKFAYCDPPYLLDDPTLYGPKGDLHRDFDHEQFAAIALAHPGGCLISYNDSPQVRELFTHPRATIHEVEGIVKGRRMNHEDDEDGTGPSVNPWITELAIRVRAP